MSQPGWFALVDTARDERLYPLVEQSGDVECLISGPVDPALAPALPYLVRLRRGEPLADAWNAEGWGQGWGLMLRSPASTAALRTHFKKFLHVRLPGGEVAMFRFWDPVIFHTHVAALPPAEQAPWFREVEAYLVEGDEPGEIYEVGWSGTGVVARRLAA